MITRKLRIILVFLALCLCLVLLVPTQAVAVAFNVKPTNSSIDGDGYSGVMADLMANDNFRVSDYLSPVRGSVDVVTVAENVDNGLFVYVYEPSYMQLDFVSINISMVDKSQTKDFKNYKLTLIDRQSSFCKFLVNDLVVGEPHRYEISSIFRGWVDGVDDSASGGNVVNEISYPISKIFTFIDGQLKVEDVEYIQITDKYVGFVRYYGGTTLFSTNECDSHFVAFSTDKKIDRLIEADVYFQTQKYQYVFSGNVSSGSFQGSPIDNYSYMTENDEVFYNGTGLWKHSYKWSRIQTAKEFIDSQEFENVYQGAIFEQKAIYNMTEESKKIIEDKQWVLRFYESVYGENYLANGWSETSTRVFNVSILRLKFETDGKTYDLGVVDNKQTGSETPDNEVKIETTVRDDLAATLKMILGFIVLLIVLVLLMPFLTPIINFVFVVIGLVFGAIKKVFAIIGKLLKGIKNEK